MNDIEVIQQGSENVTIHAETVHKEEIRKYLDKEEIQNKIMTIESARDRMFIVFLWMSGVRISEAISFKKQDIDFKNRMLKVRWLKSRKYKNRIVPLHNKLCLMLEVFTAAKKQEDVIFEFSRIQGFRIVKKHLDISPHQLRHSFAVHWLRCDGDIVTLHRVLGHSKIQTTMEYLKIVPVDQAKELDKIEF